MKKMANKNNLDFQRQSIIKKIRKLDKKYNRWRFFEKGGVSAIFAIITFFSSCFVWMPGIIGKILIGTIIVSIATVINCEISRIFVHKSMDIDRKRKKAYQQLHDYDENNRKERLHSTRFNYLTKTEISRNNCSSEEEYITKKSDDQFISGN